MNPSLSPRHDIPSFWHSQYRDRLLLHLGENPFPPTERVCQAIVHAAENANRYPDTNCLALREKIASYVEHGIQSENILVGNGSDELIDLAVVTFSQWENPRPAAPVATFSPTFFVYGFAAQRHSIPWVSIPRTPGEFDLPGLDQISPEYRSRTYSLTFIANPNNPTGTQTSRERLIEYLEFWPGMIVVDECYYEYSGETVVDLIHRYENLLVFRSLSKGFGLSGLRVGYAVACRKNIDWMERHAMTFPINVCAQAAGIAALEDVAIYRARIRELIQEREIMLQELRLWGFDVLSSNANFILILGPESWHEDQPVRWLAEQGILVSDQTATMSLGRPALRVGIGTPSENRRVMEVFRQILASKGK